MTTDLFTRARGGDGDAFRELVEPYRRELQVHCYRLLGSFQDAEDALQDTLLSAWQNLGGFEERATLRTWLYRIATNRCLNALRSMKRRPAMPWNVPDVEPPEPTRLGEILWLEPYPDALLPEARYEEAENISLAFVTALQLLPPRQRAVLILRDVLGYHADEVADLLETTVDSVTSALKRARATLLGRRPAAGGRPSARSAPPPGSPVEQALAERFVKAYQAGDVDGLVGLLTEDVCVSMPPMPFEYVGRDVAARFFAAVVLGRRIYDLVPTRANGQPAFGAYLRGPDGIRHGAGLLVLTLAGERISAVTRFESGVMAWFGLPRSLPG
jgi:RNA polymerase sigma-70 factor (ECF subfamily)